MLGVAKQEIYATRSNRFSEVRVGDTSKPPRIVDNLFAAVRCGWHRRHDSNRCKPPPTSGMLTICLQRFVAVGIVKRCKPPPSSGMLTIWIVDNVFAAVVAVCSIVDAFHIVANTIQTARADCLFDGSYKE